MTWDAMCPIAALDDMQMVLVVSDEFEPVSAGQGRWPLCHAKTAPFGETSGAVQLEI